MTSCAATTTIREALGRRASVEEGARQEYRASLGRKEWNPAAELVAIAAADLARPEILAVAALEQLVEAVQAAMEHVDPGDRRCVLCDEYLDEHDGACPIPLLAAALAAVGPGEETAE